MQEAMPYLAAKYGHYARMGQDQALPDDQTFQLPPEQLASGRFILGDAHAVTDQLLAYRDALGMNVLGLRMHWVGMPHALARRSIERFCEHVLTALRS